MSDNLSKIKISLYIIGGFVGVWIILSEFVFKASNFFPSPYQVILSYSDLFSAYDFFINLISTVSAIYFAYIFNIFLLRIIFPIINFNLRSVRYLSMISSFFFYIPGIMIGIILIYWFGDTFIIKLIFAVIVTTIFMFQKIIRYDEKKSINIIDSAKSFGMTDRQIKRNVIWKFIEPEIFEEAIDKHIYLWSAVIAFEYIQNYDGVGFILRKALGYNDISLMISLLLLITILVFLGDHLLKVVCEKYLFWN